jgi:hypothetical protein
MDSNLALMIAGGIVLSIFGIISALNASSKTAPLVWGRALFSGDWHGGLVLVMAPSGLSISDIPQAFLIAVVALVK